MYIDTTDWTGYFNVFEAGWHRVALSYPNFDSSLTPKLFANPTITTT
jgi:hypothetical protein